MRSVRALMEVVALMVPVSRRALSVPNQVGTPSPHGTTVQLFSLVEVGVWWMVAAAPESVRVMFCQALPENWLGYLWPSSRMGAKKRLDASGL
ncbi:hypothetical protein HMPREF1550_01547 [Actinomyces sp. oral taxon 877 str. F0543]|nr:hypothetical protein HMPREF1550_01547 [Actinomyces sp. oral taxon 877 str. F0543]